MSASSLFPKDRVVGESFAVLVKVGSSFTPTLYCLTKTNFRASRCMVNFSSFSLRMKMRGY